MAKRASFGFRKGRIQANTNFTQKHPPAPYIMEDMLFDVLADSPYVVVTQSGTAITAAARSATAGDPVAALYGWIAGGTDDVDAEIDEVSLGDLGTGAGTPWLRPDQVGNGVIVCEWGITVPTALTTRQYFAGLSDDPVEGTATNGSLNIQTARTVVDVATDAAGWIFSSLATAPTVWKYAATKNNTQDTNGTDATSAPGTQVADTWVGLRVEIDSTGASFFSIRSSRGGPLFSEGKSANGVTATVALVPIFTCAPTTTTSAPWEIDYGFAVASVE